MGGTEGSELLSRDHIAGYDCFLSPRASEQDLTTGTVIARYFPVIVYRIPIYRQPFHVIRTMVAPLLICDFGTILVFRMRLLPPPHSNYNDRISTLVTVLLALFAFLTYARSALPDVPVSTWMDTVIFQSNLIFGSTAWF